MVGMLAAGAGVASLYANSPLDLLVQDLPMAAYDPDNCLPVIAESGMERLYALPWRRLVVITLMISSLLARPLDPRGVPSLGAHRASFGRRGAVEGRWIADAIADSVQRSTNGGILMDSSATQPEQTDDHRTWQYGDDVFP